MSRSKAAMGLVSSEVAVTLRAAWRARPGQGPPARSARASSGSQMSAARSLRSRGELGLGGGNGRGMVEDKAGALALEGGGLDGAEPGAFLVGGLALHAEDNAAVSEGHGQAADAGDDFGAPARVPGKPQALGRGFPVAGGCLGWLIHGAQDVGGFFVVARV